MQKQYLQSLDQLLQDFNSNKNEPEYLLSVGDVFFNIGTSSIITVKQDDGIPEGRISDWHSLINAYNSYLDAHEIQPTFRSFISVLNALLALGTPDLILTTIGDNHKFSHLYKDYEVKIIFQIGMMAMARTGLIKQAIIQIQEAYPMEYTNAMEEFSRMSLEDKSSPNVIFRMVTSHLPVIFDWKSTQVGLEQYCVELLIMNEIGMQIEEKIIKSGKNWNADSCFITAREYHKLGLSRLAMNYYALALSFNPDHKAAESSFLSCLVAICHYDSAHRKSIYLINKYPKTLSNYLTGGLSAILNSKIPDVDNIVSIASLNGFSSVYLDIMEGYSLEARRLVDQTLNHYSTHSKQGGVFSDFFDRIYQRLLIQTNRVYLI